MGAVKLNRAVMKKKETLQKTWKIFLTIQKTKMDFLKMPWKPGMLNPPKKFNRWKLH